MEILEELGLSRFSNLITVGPAREARQLCLPSMVPFNVELLQHAVLHGDPIPPMTLANQLPPDFGVAEALERAGIF